MHKFVLYWINKLLKQIRCGVNLVSWSVLFLTSYV